MNDERPESNNLPFRDAEFLASLDQLAKEAAYVRVLAEQVAEKVTSEEAEIYMRELCEGLLPWVASGIIQVPQGDRKRYLQIFWHSIRALIAAQFSGFSLNDELSIKEVISLVEPAKSDRFKSRLGQQYWNHRGKRSYCKFPRLFAILSLYSIVLPRVGKPGYSTDREDLGIRTTAFLNAATVLEEVADNLKREQQQEDDIGQLNWKVSLWKLERNLYQLVHEFKESLPSSDRKRFPSDRSKEIEYSITNLEMKLRHQLAVILQLETSSPFEIADVVGVLGGRYLNPGLQIELAHRALYTRAAEYVLKHRTSRNKSWQAQQGLAPELQDPLAERYSPLAYLLDLPNAVLMPCLKALAGAADDALGSLKRELGSYQVSGLPREQANIEAKRKEVCAAIYNGLMVGAAVSERMKDLLSDVELATLGAEIPDKPVEWDTLSNSLGFKENLREGVIRPWTERSAMRPGAILVFGPPGTGKTTIAKALLHELSKGLRYGPGGGANEEWNFLALSPADFARNGSDLVIATAEQLFRRLQRVRRCIVLLDEMEEFLRTRGPETNRESRLITTAFLPLLQETVNRREIILIVATNFVGTIDHAITRRGRFDLILPLGPPDVDSRKTIVRRELDSWPSALKHKVDNYVDDIVEYTMGYTQPELLDYLRELHRSQVAQLSTKDSLRLLKSELWRIRQERVPIALSGNPGCNWRTFRDEASRFRRAAAGIDGLEKQDYWQEPKLPKFD